MGDIKHHAIIVTSWDEVLIFNANKKAIEVFEDIASVTEITKPTINSYASFLIAPDGSKEGWDHSYQGDSLRNDFIKWLESQCYDDGSTALEYAEVQFGDTYNINMLLRHSGSK